MNGLFYHDWITESADDDILDLELTETSEFVDKCPSMNPTVHFDAFNSGNRTISVPGGYKETPSGKPYDLNSVPVPGNNGEKPTGRPYDETSIKSGNKIELTDSEYNDALVALQKSFKESMDIIGALTNSKRVDKTNAQILDEAYDQAFLDAAINGAMFEKVGRADKDTVKEIVSKIQPDLFNWIKEQGFKAYKPVRFGRWMINSSNNMLWSTWWSTRMWQVLGCAILNDEDYRQFTKFVNELYANVFTSLYGIETIGLRYFNVFGRRQDPNGAYAAVIPLWVKALINHQSPFINGDGSYSRDFTYIDNVIQATL